jgi:hypothetical protein
MTTNKDYRLYITKCFETIETNVSDIKTSISSINDHLKEQNSKIAKHEEFKIKAEGIVREGKKDVENVAKKLYELECEQKIIKDDLLEYNFFKKYPKLSILLVGVFAGAMLFSFLGAIKGFQGNKIMKEVEKSVGITNQILAPEAIKRGIEIE